MPQEEYYEKPRPSLFNVIKKLQDHRGEPVNRICYVARLLDSYRGDFEKEFSNWTLQTVSNDTEKEYNPLGDAAPKYSGFALVLGSWIVHLFEAPQPLMGRYIRELNKISQTKDSYYKGIWVLHYTEQVAQPCYSSWACKSVNAQQASREIKSLPDLEKINYIYSQMVEIGLQG
jgi:hypothetical protein